MANLKMTDYNDLVLNMKRIPYNSGAIYQEAAASGSSFNGQPTFGREDGAGVHLHPLGGEGGHVEGHPLRRHERQLHIDNC